MRPNGKPRKPEAFSLDHPDLTLPPEPSPDRERAPPGSVAPTIATPRFGVGGIGRGIRWGAILVTAATALAGIALSLWFARFVSVALARHDWIGWLALTLAGVMALAMLMIVLREVIGFFRLRRLAETRIDSQAAIERRDLAGERRAIERVVAPFTGRPELRWPLARLNEHAAGVRDPGDLARLADRDVLSVLDGDARRLIAGAARRVSMVSALSPMALITVGWVLVENLKLLRGIAGLYGGRPGFIGTARLARMVLTHIIATGGIAMTDDLLGQFLGQDLLRRLSRRLGESLFNAALTARIGAAAVDVIRPLPFIDAKPVRARDFLAELTRRRPSDADAAGKPGAQPSV